MREWFQIIFGLAILAAIALLSLGMVCAGTLKPVTAQEHANTIITDVKCILTASIDILSSPSGLSTESTLAINLEVAAGLLETAETLMSLAEGE